MQVEIFKTSRGAIKLGYNNYIYWKKKVNLNGTITWLCCECSARLRTDDVAPYGHPVVLGNHTHESNETTPGLLRCREAMKTRIQEHPETISTVIYREKLLEVPLNVAVALPSKDYVARALRAERSKRRPPLPATAADLQLAPYQTLTRCNHRFLLLDTVHEGDRMLVFSSDFFINLLCEAQTVFADGTFRTVPRIFNQCFTINFLYQEKLLPAVYALVRRKTQSVYQRILRAIQESAEERGLQFSPANFLTDFEVGLMSAITVQLPAAQQRGCFFHFCQCCFRHIQTLGLQHVYRVSNSNRIILRVTMALAFLPEDQILPTFQRYKILIEQHVPLLVPFMNYFQQQWINTVLPAVWCVHGRAVRTNNDIEGWHFAMKRAIGQDHPDVHAFLK
jgi:hypothetical protein